MNPVYFCKRTLNSIINNGGPMMLDAGIAKNKVPREGEFCNGPNGRDKRLMRVLELFDDLVQGGQVFLKLYFCCLLLCRLLRLFLLLLCLCISHNTQRLTT